MKCKIIILFLLIPFSFYAQAKKKKKRAYAKPQTQELYQYYQSNNLPIDSAQTPYLYYQVYDWLGTCYKYSGKTKKGIDCSGFVSEMYKDTYCINLTGGSKDIWPTVNPVEKTEIKEGDILFFKIRKGQISHVGVYLGNNKFAHASVNAGVIISDLNEAYYKKHFYKGGRVGYE